MMDLRSAAMKAVDLVSVLVFGFGVLQTWIADYRAFAALLFPLVYAIVRIRRLLRKREERPWLWTLGLGIILAVTGAVRAAPYRSEWLIRRDLGAYQSLADVCLSRVSDGPCPLEKSEARLATRAHVENEKGRSRVYVQPAHNYAFLIYDREGISQQELDGMRCSTKLSDAWYLVRRC